MSKKLLDPNKMYYIQNGYVGNAISWWGANHRDYTTDITKAGRYTAEQTKVIIQRPEDIAWPCDYIDSKEEAKKLIVDMQYLESAEAIRGATK